MKMVRRTSDRYFVTALQYLVSYSHTYIGGRSAWRGRCESAVDLVYACSVWLIGTKLGLRKKFGVIVVRGCGVVWVRCGGS